MQDNKALLIIDVQVGMFESPLGLPVYNGQELLAKVRDLIRKGRSVGVPIFYIQHNGGKGHRLESGKEDWKIHASIAPMKDDVVIQKHKCDSFYKTGLQEELEKRNIKKVVVAGIQTDYCVDTTCRRAFSLGYDITLVKDAHSTWETEVLSAQQIIAHHNYVLGDSFVTLESADEIDFSKI
ncbi:MAG: cysteine hydrolase [Ignavibacteriales bacterium]|nr:cysteine hydrolase [Ignavibacteriales bacterium]